MSHLYLLSPSREALANLDGSCRAAWQDLIGAFVHAVAAGLRQPVVLESFVFLSWNFGPGSRSR
jgi:hypothetical protein